MQQYQNQPSLPPPQPNPNAIAVPPIVSQGLVVQDIQTYFQQYENLLAGFVPNVDLRVIPSKKGGNSIMLTKAGAEKICRFLGLSHTLIPRQHHIDFANNTFLFQYECQLFLHNSLVGNGFGNCNNLETKYKDSYSPDILNTIDKMAQKRAFIQAVLFTTGGSRFFRKLEQ